MSERHAVREFDKWVERATESGLLCSHCGCEFLHASGHPVSCSYCFKRLTVAEQKKYPLCVYKERNPEKHAAEARARRTIREAREARRQNETE